MRSIGSSRFLNLCGGSFGFQIGRFGLQYLGLGLCLAFRLLTARFGFLESSLYLRVELVDLFLKFSLPVGVSLSALRLELRHVGLHGGGGLVVNGGLHVRQRPPE